jgi:NADH:ubiquinone reductase (H+-translocating)
MAVNTENTSLLTSDTETLPHVLVIGGGFGGLEVAKSLRKSKCRVTLVDRRNHHVFQPLLYQVATAALSPAEIASPIRNILRGVRNCRVVLGEVDSVDLNSNRVIIRDVAVRYDYLVLAAGATHSYFGRDDYASAAPGLKTLEDAIEIRKRIILSFEEAEYEGDPELRRAKLTFMIIGGGPTGVELAGAIKEIAAKSLPAEFRNIDTTTARIILVEGSGRLLGTFPSELSESALKQLTEMGVEVKLNCRVTDVQPGAVTIGEEQIRAQNIFWAAGVQGNKLSKKLGAELDRAGRVIVAPDCSVPGHRNVFVIGDMAAHKEAETGKQVPGVAQGAIQTGQYVGKLIGAEITGGSSTNARAPFRYFDKGSLATIGRARAVGEVFGFKVYGFIAWLFWAVVHIMFIVEFRNRIAVATRWGWNWLLHARDTRLIIGGSEIQVARVNSKDAVLIDTMGKSRGVL